MTVGELPLGGHPVLRLPLVATWREQVDELLSAQFPDGFGGADTVVFDAENSKKCGNVFARELLWRLTDAGVRTVLIDGCTKGWPHFLKRIAEHLRLPIELTVVRVREARSRSGEPDVTSVAYNLSHRAIRAGQVSDITPEGLFAVLDRLGRECVWCGGPFESFDHVVPTARGGGDVLENLVPSCHECNGLKGNLSPEDWVDGQTVFVPRVSLAPTPDCATLGVHTD